MPSKTIRSMISEINNPEADGGGLWLPNIQRLFVWGEDQIERLFDSIMRQYPLPSMMVWKTRQEIRSRKFIDQYYERIDLRTLYQPVSTKVKRLVLDGQQRLQSLYIGLKGSIEGRELHLNLLSGTNVIPEDICYKFSFLDGKQAGWPWVRFKDIIFSNEYVGDIAKRLIDKSGEELSDDDKRLISRNIERAKREFEVCEALLFQEIDGVDTDDEKYKFDDVVEIFIRANSGGTKLSKSDLMFTLLTASWDTADIDMQEFLVELNDSKFKFDRDFAIKTAMVLVGQNARYDVEKLRNDKLKKKISDEWTGITDAIKYVRDIVATKTYIHSDKALLSYNALIPLIYYRYRFSDEFKDLKSIKDYLLRALLTGAFSGRPDGLIDKLVSNIKQEKTFNKQQIFRVIEEDGRYLKISEDNLFSMGYGTGQVHLLFNMWYASADYRPAYDGHLPQIDHIFPQSQLKKVKDVDPDTNRPRQIYAAREINQLANCMLLTADENGAGQKSDKLPEVWFADKDDEYLELHCIPKNKRLWKIEKYEKFITERKKLIRKKFAQLLLED